MKKRAGTIIKLIIGLAILVWLIIKCDPAEMLEVLKRIHPLPVAGACLVFLGGVVFSAYPWKMLMPVHKLELSAREAIELSLMSFCVNNLLPGGLGGDALRAWAFMKKTARPEPCAATVLLDRWLAFVCLIFIVIIITVYKWEQIAQIGLLQVMFGVLAVFAVMFAVSLIMFAGGLKFLKKPLEKIRFGTTAAGFSESLLEYCHHLKTVALCLILTSVTPILDALGFWFLGLSLDNSCPFWSYVLMIPVLRVIHHIPVSVNAVGTQDAACIFYWGAFGVGSAEALTMSMAAHALKILAALISGAIYMISWRGRLDWYEAEENINNS